ncbi:flagellar basal-body MS-ring/collar protein FliF [Alicyclobacillus sp.]|uniref:flagellar basal-body MS-ring/collar protein FliF n=1 Tax=Alicyclobacillus sp. TaxID=61169 RepID=UPI0025B85284|nr:flagellar basal-body MS-ring/collar protein FliF [Alicyclobacillus sp.]
MNDRLRQGWSRIVQWWRSIAPVRRRNLTIAAAAGALCLAAVLWILLRPNYVTILSGLDNKSLGQVQAKLQDLKIPNRIEGSSVLVPARDADTARVQLSMAGLPQSGYIGYASIPNSFAMTQDQFNVQVLDVLQQSLAQTIESINGVTGAQVHIVMPDPQLFVSQPADTAKASVFLQLGPGVQLTPAQVAGIQQLVAHSVKGLSADDVTVVDQNGVSLTSPSAANGAATTQASTEIQLRRQLEQALTQQLTAGLNQIVGPGNAVVMVHANVTFDQVQSKAHTYQAAPGQTTGLPNRTEVTRKTSNSTSGGVGGPAGQASSNPNLPTYAGAGAGGGSSSSSETDTTTTYDNSYVDTVKNDDPVQIQGYQVAVMLNQNDPAITPAVLNEIRSFVSNAVGARSGNGANNDISVVSVPFHNPSAPVQGMWPSRWIVWTAGAAVAAAVILLLWLLLRRRRTHDEVAVALEAPVPVEALESLPKSEDERIREELLRFAERKPAEFAGLLRSWLASD